MSFKASSTAPPDDVALTTSPRSDLEAAGRRLREQPPLCPTDSDAVVPSRAPARAASARKVDKRSSEYIWKSGVAGGLAGCAAKTVVGPLDRVKILFQAQSPQFAKYTGSWFGVVTAMSEIHRVAGVRGLFRGHSATLLRIFPYAGIKFLAYEQVRAFFIRDRSQETPIRRFLSGSISGMISVFFTYPLEVIRVRLAFETKNVGRSSLVDICKQIYHEMPPRRIETGATARSISSAPSGDAARLASTTVENVMQSAVPRSGLVNFYRGFTPTLWGMIPYAGASFLTHDLIGDVLRHPTLAAHTTIPNSSREGKKPAQLTSWAQLFAGGFAGFVSQTVSYPLEVIRRRMQVGGAVGDGRRLRMAEVATQVWRQSGWRGFFVGLAIGYVKVIPMTATSFYVYERSKHFLGI